MTTAEIEKKQAESQKLLLKARKLNAEIKTAKRENRKDDQEERIGKCFIRISKNFPKLPKTIEYRKILEYDRFNESYQVSKVFISTAKAESWENIKCPARITEYWKTEISVEDFDNIYNDVQLSNSRLNAFSQSVTAQYLNGTNDNQ